MPTHDLRAMLWDLDADVPSAVADDLGSDDLFQHVKDLGVRPEFPAGVAHDGSVLVN